MKAHAVIGAGYGDEGKGLLVDYIAASLPNPLVVRFNGGAQAGHTVVTPTGKRHVFRHFGAGAFAGAATLLSRFFVCNPILFLQEHAELAALDANLRVFVDPEALVTTLYDMLVNQVIEIERGTGRHGSCGVGFGETIERDAEFGLRYKDLRMKRALLSRRLMDIRNKWVPDRLRALGLNLADLCDKSYEIIGLGTSLGALNQWLTDAHAFASLTSPYNQQHYLGERSMIFEGAQGLMLDQSRFSQANPHVTRSFTGLRNVRVLCAEFGITDLDAVYVHRSYATRHGAGPLPCEVARTPYIGVRDETNVENQFQGALRYGYPDLRDIVRAIYHDYGEGLGGELAVAVTCQDQVDPAGLIYRDPNGVMRVATPAAFARSIGGLVEADTLIHTYGATRGDVYHLRCPTFRRRPADYAALQ